MRTIVKMKQFWKLLELRWRNSMPKFFRTIFLICSLISGTALAINTAIIAAGAVPHDWWTEIYPYFIGIPAGAKLRVFSLSCRLIAQMAGLLYFRYNLKSIDEDMRFVILPG